MSKYEIYQNQGGTWVKIGGTAAVSTSKTGTATTRFDYLTVDGVEKLLGVTIPHGDTLPTVSATEPPECRWFCKTLSDEETMIGEGVSELYFYHPNYRPSTGTQFWMKIGNSDDTDKIRVCTSFDSILGSTREEILTECKNKMQSGMTGNYGVAFFSNATFTEEESPTGSTDEIRGWAYVSNDFSGSDSALFAMAYGNLYISTKSMLGEWSSWKQISPMAVHSTYSGLVSGEAKYIEIGGLVYNIAPTLTAKGSTTKPVYVNSTGSVAECTTYAGGTKVTLNGSAKGGADITIIAPTAAQGSATQPLYATASGMALCTQYAGGTAVTLNGTSKAGTTASFIAATGALGSATKPLYATASGMVECSTYAGGTKMTVNGSGKGGGSASIYCPTSAPSDKQVCVGSNTTPAWQARKDFFGIATATYTLAGLTFNLAKSGRVVTCTVTGSATSTGTASVNMDAKFKMAGSNDLCQVIWDGYGYGSNPRLIWAYGQGLNIGSCSNTGSNYRGSMSWIADNADL